RGALDRRLRALGRGAGGALCNRRGGAAPARSPGRSRVGQLGLALRGAAESAELYQAAGVSRSGGSPGVALGEPRRDRALAAVGGGAADPGAAAGFVGTV